MKQVILGRNGISLEEVPPPLAEDGSIIVRTAYSLISTGTEMSNISGSRDGLISKVIKQPEKVGKLLYSFHNQGVLNTINLVRRKLDNLKPLGYSCSGIVIELGKGISDLQSGDRVACAGAGIANHAEYIVVPRNLVVKLPEGVDLRDAASTTVGAISMQGVRRADLRLGEWAAVIGLGLLGQITVQLLRATGVRVIGFDIDPFRVEKALSLGMNYGFVSRQSNVENEVFQLTHGYGVDATILTAASKSDALVQQAMQLTRKKGRVVVVGAVGLNLNRSPFYEKEIDFLISCSYGPGRYDSKYEQEGVDYPYPYVRWTENRNMQEYLHLLADKKVDFASLIESEVQLEQVEQAYTNLSGEHPPIAVILKYSESDQMKIPEAHRIELRKFNRKSNEKIRVALVGAGSFAQGMHLPNLLKCSDAYQLLAIATRTGLTGRNLGNQFGADYITSDYNDVLIDPNVDLVLICTRHNQHAEQCIQAIRAGKAVFVEKPLALTLEEVDAIQAALTENPVPFMVGFNRRFSPAMRRVKEILKQNNHPVQMLYRVNAGYLPQNHWTQGSEGGGRIIGEACHMLDVFQYLVGQARVRRFHLAALSSDSEHISSKDNVSIHIEYSDGSLGTLIYSAMGASTLPKEYLEIHSGGKSLVVDDYMSLRVHGSPEKGWESRVQDKGHLEEIKQFAVYIRGRGPEPILFEDITATSRLSIQISNTTSSHPAEDI